MESKSAQTYVSLLVLFLVPLGTRRSMSEGTCCSTSHHNYRDKYLYMHCILTTIILNVNRYEALQAFIQSQKTLLARTQSDIQRLRGLRADANAANSNSELEGFVENLDDKVRSVSSSSAECSGTLSIH